MEEGCEQSKRRADFRRWSLPFLFTPERLQVLNPNADTTSKTFVYKRAVQNRRGFLKSRRLTLSGESIGPCVEE